jgi:hypothetical protein
MYCIYGYTYINIYIYVYIYIYIYSSFPPNPYPPIYTGQAVFMLSVQLLESLRAGGRSLELRPMLHYLNHPALDSSPHMRYIYIYIYIYIYTYIYMHIHIYRNEMAAIADHVFSVFIEVYTCIYI